MTKWARNGCLNLLLLMTTLSTSPILETRLKKPFSSNRKVCFCLLKNVDEGHSGLHTVSFQLSRLLCTAYCGRASKGLFSYQLHGLSCTRALRGRYHSGKQSLHSNRQGCRVSNSDNQNYFRAKISQLRENLFLCLQMPFPLISENSGSICMLKIQKFMKVQCLHG